jgi:hypothetical protein
MKKKWKIIIIILVILAIIYFNGLIGFFHIPFIGFNSGGAIVGGYKECSCIGIPNNDVRIGGSRFYCIGIVSDCHCYLTGYPKTDIKQEVDCNCPEGNYTAGIDYCNLFRSW